MGLVFGLMDALLTWVEPRDHRLSLPEAPFQAPWSHLQPVPETPSWGCPLCDLLWIVSEAGVAQA